MTWPIVEGISLMHLHVNRGKRSIVLDLQEPTRAWPTFLDLVARRPTRWSRPCGPARSRSCGLGYDDLREVNPQIVFCTISGYGMTGPYKNLPSHGIAYDTWAGIVNPAYDDDGFCYMPEHVSIGINAGPLYGALGILAGVIRARETGEGCRMEIAQSDAAAAIDWYRSETWQGLRAPRVRGHRQQVATTTSAARRAPRA